MYNFAIYESTDELTTFATDEKIFVSAHRSLIDNRHVKLPQQTGGGQSAARPVGHALRGSSFRQDRNTPLQAGNPAHRII